MPVLFLTLAAFVFFVLVLIALSVAQLAERKEERRLFLRIPGKAFTVISIAQAFEEDSAILWETQVPALQLVATGGPKGAPVTKVRRFFASTSKRYPELYEGVYFEQWVHFLEEAELVTIAPDEKIAITPQGLEFLKYRLTTKRIAA